MLRKILFILSIFIGVQSFAQTKLIPYWPKLKSFRSPLGIVHAPGLRNSIFIVEQRGKIYEIKDDASSVTKSLLVDMSSIVSQSGSETGLLGLAFHPDFQKNGRLFVSYTKGQGKKMVSNISEMRVADPLHPQLPKSIAKVLISVSQPYENHNGGALCFGPDGYLYFSWGDGGSGGDPHRNGQNISVLLGKIHRIDVNKSSNGKLYSVPADNPFVAIPDAKQEIYAYGLRNVWQMHFDEETGKLWAGDVGQNAWEEIDIIENGKNYGWNIKEAASDFELQNINSQLEPPVWFYSQKDGDKSVTGGLIYHGSNKSLQNQYIYGDFMTGRIWNFNPVNNENKLLVKKSRIQISSFGTNQKKEILICDYNSGVIYQLKP